MNRSSPDAAGYSYDEIKVGFQTQQSYQISLDVYEAFLSAFDDRSPVHVDEDYAIGRKFLGTVMHGAILNGFLSHFIGMVFPGRNSLLLGADLRYSQPCYLNDSIELRATVGQKLDVRRVVSLRVVFTNATRRWIAGRGRVQVMVVPES